MVLQDECMGRLVGAPLQCVPHPAMEPKQLLKMTSK